MFLLAIETTGRFCGVALINDKDEIVSFESDTNLNHLKDLMPLIKKAMEYKQITLNDLSAIAVSNGPGSFTGIRIGVSTARGISQIKGISCIEVDSMQAFALRDFLVEKENHIMISKEDKIVCAMVDARQNQVYTSVAKNGKILFETSVETADEFLAKLFEYLKNETSILKLVFKGDGAIKYKEQITEFVADKKLDLSVDIIDSTKDAVGVAYLGKEKFLEGNTINYTELLPKYMRKPEAQRRLEERLNNGQ